MHNDIERLLLSESQIQARIKELGAQLAEDYRDKNPVMICILKGSTMFFADLLRAMDIRLTMDFMAVSSYGSGTESSGNIKIIKDLDEPIKDKHVLIVEDIIDSGRTLSKLVELLKHREPASLEICTLLDKPDRRVVEIEVPYTCFVVPDAFVVGYGLDYDQKYRNLPYIGVVEVE